MQVTSSHQSWVCCLLLLLSNFECLSSGYGENGIEDIKRQPFFKTIDFEVRCYKLTLYPTIEM